MVWPGPSSRVQSGSKLRALHTLGEELQREKIRKVLKAREDPSSVGDENDFAGRFTLNQIVQGRGCVFERIHRAD